MKPPLVVTVILNTNRRNDTLACLNSLAEGRYENNRILVLDNASTDGSVSAIRRAHPDVTVVELDENRGYAGNNNVGIETAISKEADWIFVLNEDTILAPDCVSLLVAVGENHSKFGIVGPLVYHYDEPDFIQSAGGHMNRWLEATHIGQNEQDTGQFSTPREVDWISGCAILVRRALIEDIGMLDERFFYYWEETEWCLRARRAGWRIANVPQAKLWHKGVQRDYKPSPDVTYYDTRNRLLMLAKHQAPWYVQARAWVRIGRRFAAWTIRPKWSHMRDHRKALCAGVKDYLNKRWGVRQV